MRTGELALALEQAGYDVLWWTTSVDHLRRRQRSRGSYRIHVSQGLRIQILHAPNYGSSVSPLRLAGYLGIGGKILRRAPREAKPNVIIASLSPLEPTLAMARVAARIKVPYIVDVRDLYPDTLERALVGVIPNRAARALVAPYRAGVRRLLRDAAAVAAISPTYLEWARDLGGRMGTKDRVLPIGYPAHSSCSETDIALAKRKLKRIGVRFDQRIAWFVGSFNRLTDLRPVIAAARLVQHMQDSSGVPFQFVLSGAGPLASEYRKQAAGLPNVCFTGFIDRCAIEALKRHAWIGIGAYSGDAEPVLRNKHFEYLSAGLPIASNLDGEVGELIRRAQVGFVYHVDDGSDLLTRLLELADNGAKYEQMARNASELFLSNYTVDQVNEAYLEVIDVVAGRSEGLQRE